jgi:hypothetical protein
MRPALILHPTAMAEPVLVFFPYHSRLRNFCIRVPRQYLGEGESKGSEDTPAFSLAAHFVMFQKTLKRVD